jgi:hypothetical protein
MLYRFLQQAVATDPYPYPGAHDGGQHRPLPLAVTPATSVAPVERVSPGTSAMSYVLRVHLPAGGSCLRGFARSGNRPGRLWRFPWES